MFNRSFQIRLVKANKSVIDEITEDTNVADQMYIVHETAKGVAKMIVGVMAAYIALDTMRIVADNLTQK